eukprot:TRINITY_DN10580_c0_g1_i1.p1 TRINITY_DN10580_c0_g1~~TRINITY_DN10580_c0_g1_i1.p1  ORF type:complete len:698 (-),score=165.59 TRINITY_DN10580_c0_g1_i1:8-2101(-)
MEANRLEMKGNDSKSAAKRRRSLPQKQSTETKEHRAKYVNHRLLEERSRLPVFAAKKRIIDAVSQNDCIILMGETGSGKTTQIPQFLLDGDFASSTNRIGVTQPRRVAATTVAKRVSEEMGVELGNEVGYAVRFEDCVNSSTVIKFMTDGILLREAMLDPNLSRYSVLILDEAHERTLHTDILFGIVKGLLTRRKGDIKVVIMSATLDADRFSSYFFNAPVFYVEGRQYPVDIYYTPTAEPDYLDAALISIIQIHMQRPPGDILVFLTGQEDIESLERLLDEKAKLLSQDFSRLHICPIFAALPPEKQMAVFEPSPPGHRKVVLATNIAETSITIDGIRYVVDGGLVKTRGYLPKIGLEALVVTEVSKAAARQRSGRAGRQAAGECYRLYTEDSFWKLRDETVPEIKRVNLASVILQLKVIGVEDILNFDFMDQPPKSGLQKALEVLYSLGALDTQMRLTDPIGKIMASFPLDPPFSRAIIASKDLGCTKEVLAIVSMLSTENVFFMPPSQKDKALEAHRKFASSEGDHFTLLNVFLAFQSTKQSKTWCFENFVNYRSIMKAVDVYQQLVDYSKQLEIPLVSILGSAWSAKSGSTADLVNSSRTSKDAIVQIGKALLSGFNRNVAILQPDQRYSTILENQTVQIHPSSVLMGRKAKYVMYNELVLTSKQYMRNLLVLDVSWLAEVAPHMFSKKVGAV